MTYAALKLPQRPHVRPVSAVLDVWLFPKLTTKLIHQLEKQHEQETSPASRHEQPITEPELSLGGDKAPRRGSSRSSKQRGRRENRGGGESRKNTRHKNTTLTAFLASFFLPVLLQTGFRVDFKFHRDIETLNIIFSRLK